MSVYNIKSKYRLNFIINIGTWIILVIKKNKIVSIYYNHSYEEKCVNSNVILQFSVH